MSIAEQIDSLDHLYSISDESWEKLSRIPEVVKRLIKDYVQLNMNTIGSRLEQQSSDPYQNSKATLLADIHRVRRYFYYKIEKIHLIPYLSRQAVDLAIEEVKRTYDDDGNILLNIQNYLRTFCLENRFEDEKVREEKRSNWRKEFNQLTENQPHNDAKLDQLQREANKLEENLNVYEQRKENISSLFREKELSEKIKAKLNDTTMNRCRSNARSKKIEI